MGISRGHAGTVWQVLFVSLTFPAPIDRPLEKSQGCCDLVELSGWMRSLLLTDDTYIGMGILLRMQRPRSELFCTIPLAELMSGVIVLQTASAALAICCVLNLVFIPQAGAGLSLVLRDSARPVGPKFRPQKIPGTCAREFATLTKLLGDTISTIDPPSSGRRVPWQAERVLQRKSFHC
ncbi:hypothetical protein BC834DRAFT_557103 [Gloeopeniophorella convolvens]|nr:hypothetical protein BC834DRAFT_557103 [Gloeopeniophorella convolvens]